MAHVMPVEEAARAALRLAEAEALGAAVGVGLGHVVGSRPALVAESAVHVVLAEALGGLLAADLLRGAAHVAVTQLAVGVGPAARLAPVTRPRHDVRLTPGDQTGGSYKIAAIQAVASFT